MLTGLTMAGGFLLLSASISISDGTYNHLIDLFTRTHTGHIQIHHKGYLDQPSLYKTIPHWEKYFDILRTIPNIEGIAPRIYSSALAFANKKTSGVQVMGIHPEYEIETSTQFNRIKEGRFFQTKEVLLTKEVLIGSGLRDVLKVDVGGDLVLISQGADGSIANDIFKVIGIIDSKDDASGGLKVFLPLSEAQEFLSMKNLIHEIAITVPHQKMAREVSVQIQKKMHHSKLEVSPWQVVEKEFYSAMQADRQGTWITLFIIMLIVAIGVLNTILMAILERTREYGVMKALGTRPFTIFILITLESGFLSLLAIGVGLVLSSIAIFFLAHYGIPLGEPIEFGGIYFEKMLAEFSLDVFGIPAIVVFLTAIFVSIFPAFRALRISPIDALRD